MADKNTLANLLTARRDYVARLGEKSRLLVQSYLDRASKRLMTSVAKTDALSPLSILSRGYSIAERKGEIISSSSQLEVGDEVRIVLSDGSASTTVTEIKKENMQF